MIPFRGQDERKEKKVIRESVWNLINQHRRTFEEEWAAAEVGETAWDLEKEGLCVEAAIVDPRKFCKCGVEIRSHTQNCGDIRREHGSSRKCGRQVLPQK